MKVNHVDTMLEAASTKKPHLRDRHHARHQHKPVLILFAVAALLLLVVLLVSFRQVVSTPKFTPSKQSVSSEVSSTANGIASDFSLVTASDLSDSLVSE